MVSNVTGKLQQTISAARNSYSQGKCNDALALFSDALEQAHQTNAPESVVAEIFFELGLCHQTLNDFTDAQRRYKQSLHTCERAFGPNSPQAERVLQYLSALPNATAQPAPSAPQARDGRPGKNASSFGPPAAETKILDNSAQGRAGTQKKPDAMSAKESGTNLPPARGHTNLSRTSDYQEKVNRVGGDNDPINVEVLVHPREKVYGLISAIVSCMIYALLIISIVGIVLIPIGYLIQYLLSCIFHGQLRSNGIRISPQQFPEVYESAERICDRMGMKLPEMFVIQEHGLLNAYAKRAHHKDVVVIYSSVFEMAYEHGLEELMFIVAHELTHVKRQHVKLAWLRTPAAFVPFLYHAYSRACEYTCDRVAATLIPGGALYGLVALASGTHLYKHVNLAALHQQQDSDWDFWTWYAEILSTHPNLVNRIRATGLRVLPDDDQSEDNYSRAPVGGRKRFTHGTAIFLIALSTAFCFGQPPAQARNLERGGHHHVIQRKQQKEESRSEPAKDESQTDDSGAASTQDQDNQSTDQSQSATGDQGSSSSDQSADPGILAQQTANILSKTMTVAVAEIFLIGFLVITAAGGGALNGLLICAFVYNIGKLFRGGRKPTIG